MPNRYPTASESKTNPMGAVGYRHPGKITHGPGNNKPRIHLVSSKGKIPAGVYAEAIALKQKQNKLVNPSGTNGSKANPSVGAAQTTMPPGVAGYKVKPVTGLN